MINIKEIFFYFKYYVIMLEMAHLIHFLQGLLTKEHHYHYYLILYLITAIMYFSTSTTTARVVPQPIHQIFFFFLLIILEYHHNFFFNSQLCLPIIKIIFDYLFSYLFKPNHLIFLYYLRCPFTFLRLVYYPMKIIEINYCQPPKCLKSKEILSSAQCQTDVHY